MTPMPDQKLKKYYDQLFKSDPAAANLFLLLVELADENGQITPDEEELALLFSIRFGNPTDYSLGGNDDE